MNSKFVLSFIYIFKARVKKLAIFQNSKMVSCTYNFLNETFKETSQNLKKFQDLTSKILLMPQAKGEGMQDSS